MTKEEVSRGKVVGEEKGLNLSSILRWLIIESVLFLVKFGEDWSSSFSHIVQIMVQIVPLKNFF